MFSSFFKFNILILISFAVLIDGVVAGKDGKSGPVSNAHEIQSTTSYARAQPAVSSEAQQRSVRHDVAAMGDDNPEFWAAAVAETVNIEANIEEAAIWAAVGVAADQAQADAEEARFWAAAVVAADQLEANVAETAFGAAVGAIADQASTPNVSVSEKSSSAQTSSSSTTKTNSKKRGFDDDSESSKKSRVFESTSSPSSGSTASTSTRNLSQVHSSPSSDPLDSKCSVLTPEVVQFERIQGRENHLNCLISMIESAEKEIEIFSYKLKFLPKDLFRSLRNAAIRGVKVKLIVNEVTSEWALDNLEHLGITVDYGRQTHTKFAIVDSEAAIIGSFNFLDEDRGYSDDDNGECSFVISTSSDLVKRIRGKIYADLIRYERGQNNLPVPLEVPLRNNSKGYILTNLGQHEVFFKSMMKQANEKVIFYSPFITFPNAVERLKVVSENLKPSVSLEIRVNADQERRLYAALKGFSRLKQRTTIVPGNFHRKSLIVDPHSDNPTICEGSFNWLCASTAASSGGHNQETSLLLMGSVATDYVQDDELQQ